MFTPGRSWAMTFTSRVASVMVRASILIDLVFSKTLIRKARLTLGFFFTPKLARAGSQVTYPVASCNWVQGPGSESGKDNDCYMYMFCYNVYTKMVNAYMIEE